MDHPITPWTGNLLWSGEHWISALRNEGEEQPSVWVSLFHTRWSSAGEGNAAHIRIAGPQPLNVVCYDNLEVAAFCRENFFRRGPLFTGHVPDVPAKFRREGDVRSAPEWILETDKFQLRATWQVQSPPEIADGTFRAGTRHFSIFFFADEATVELNGSLLPGNPYPRDIWKPTLGGLRSSCVFALAESFLIRES